MKIEQVVVSDLILNRLDPTWKFALGSRPQNRGILVKVVSQKGVTGYGFAAELPHIGYPLEALRQTATAMAAKLTGEDARERRPLLDNLEQECGNCKPARAAFEMALYDMTARSYQVPLYQLFGGRYRRHVPILRILSIKKPEEVAANAKLLADAGYRYLKIKIDNEDPELDAARVAAVRQAVGENIHLTLDANQSYSAEQAISFYHNVARYRIDLFEQPVPVDDLEGIKFVTQSVNCLVEGDESAATVEDVYRLVSQSAVTSISLKLLKLGGMDAMVEAASICRVGGVKCRIGAHVGGRLLNAAAMHMAAAIPNIDYACEIGEFEQLLGDPFEELTIQNGCLDVPEKMGIGVTMNGGVLT